MCAFVRVGVWVWVCVPVRTHRVGPRASGTPSASSSALLRAPAACKATGGAATAWAAGSTPAPAPHKTHAPSQPLLLPPTPLLQPHQALPLLLLLLLLQPQPLAPGLLPPLKQAALPLWTFLPSPHPQLQLLVKAHTAVAHLRPSHCQKRSRLCLRTRKANSQGGLRRCQVRRRAPA